MYGVDDAENENDAEEYPHVLSLIPKGRFGLGESVGIHCVGYWKCKAMRDGK